MSISKARAIQVAKLWINQQEDLPEGCFTLARGYNAGHRGRLLSVMLCLALARKKKTEDFCVIELFILDDESVSIHRDRRRYLREHLREVDATVVDKWGVERYDHATAVSNFIAAVRNPGEDTPAWILGFETVPPPRLNVDAYVTIETLSPGKDAQIPVKVSTSRKAKASYFRKRSGIEAERTIGIVVKPKHSPPDIRSEFYAYIEKVRANRRHR